MNLNVTAAAEDISEISSTSSQTENKEAFYKKIESRKYKFLLTLLLSAISSFLIIWFAGLTRATLTVLERLEFDFGEVNKRALAQSDSKHT
jgi:hypothetical protein